MSNPQLLSQVLQLTPAERLELIEDVWDSIPNTLESLPLNDEIKSELERRLADHRRNPTAGSSWEDVKARLLERK